MKIIFLDHLCVDLAKAANISLLDAVPYDRFNILFTRAYRILWKGQSAQTEREDFGGHVASSEKAK